MRHCLAGGVLRDLLRGVSRTFARAFESDAAGGSPADHIAVHVGDPDLRVAESRQNVRDARQIFLACFALMIFFPAASSPSNSAAVKTTGVSAGLAASPAGAAVAPAAGAGFFAACHLRVSPLSLPPVYRLFIRRFYGGFGPRGIFFLFRSGGFLFWFVSHIFKS